MKPTFQPVPLTVDAEHPAYRALVPTDRMVSWSDRPIRLLVEVLYVAEGKLLYGRTATPGFYVDVTPVEEDELDELPDRSDFKVDGDEEDDEDEAPDADAMWKACGFVFETRIIADLDAHPAADAILLTALACAIEPALPALAVAWATDEGDTPWIANAILTGALAVVLRDPSVELLYQEV